MYGSPTFRCLLCFLCLVSTIAVALDPAHFPIRRFVSGIGIGYYANVADNTRAKYGYPQYVKKKRQSSADLPITDQNVDATYFISVTVGTSPQSFDVVIDTGSSDFWLASTQCVACTGTHLFNIAGSTTLTSSAMSVSIPYGSGSATGVVVQDTVSMGGFTVGNQTWVAVSSVTGNIIEGSVSGIMGFAFQNLAKSGGMPFWQGVAAEMAFFFTRSINQGKDPGGTVASEERGGVFTLGGTNSTLFTGDIDFINIMQNGFWALAVTSLSIGGKSIPITTGNGIFAAIDTGSSLIGGPSTDVTAFWSAVQGSQSVTDPSFKGFFSFPCTTILQVTIAFGGKSWAISNVDMNLGQISPGQCLGAIIVLGDGSTVGSGNPSWIIGDTFLKNVYSVFRTSPPSVGFAALSPAALALDP